MASFDETAGLLSRVRAFASLDQNQLVEIAAVCVVRSFEPGQVVFREGDRGDTCYVVQSGMVRVSRRHPDGREIALAELSERSIFGELAMFDSQVRSATVTAIEPTKVLALAASDMRRLLQSQPQLAVSLLQGLSDRLRDANDRLLSQSFQTLGGRVARALLGRLQASAGDGADGTIISITQHELAQLAGSSRESTSRFLASLAREGIVTLARGRVVVHDPDALRSYIH